MQTFFPRNLRYDNVLFLTNFRNGSLKGGFFSSSLNFYYTEFLERTKHFIFLREELVPNSANYSYVIQIMLQYRNGIDGDGQGYQFYKK